jgi:hypothetical protein
MTDKIEDLIRLYFDDLLTPDQEDQLNCLIRKSPENARIFARAASFENHLGDLIRAGNSLQMGNKIGNGNPLTYGNKKKISRGFTISWIGGLTSLALVISFLVWWGNPGSLNAGGEMNRLIDASSKPTDRTYLIRNLDTKQKSSNDHQAQIDGAILHVRQPDQYVLIRKFPDGRAFLTGSDGEQSWSLPPRGPVRVSNNPLRFRGPVPGNQHGVPFVNLRSDLVQMRDAYFITLEKTETMGLRKIMAEKKSKDYRGPNHIELWYEPETLVIQRMVFAGMPQAKGGPNSVSMELVDQDFLGPQFFDHNKHHGKEIHIIEEDY